MNIVHMILDTLRKDHLGCYGNSWVQTPNLDAFARESLKFTRAYPESLPLGIEPPQPEDGVDLSVIFEGKDPPPRTHITTAFNNFVWVTDRRYALIYRNDGSEPKLYDIQSDPECERNIDDHHPELVKQLFDLVLKDASGEPIPTYDLRRPVEEWYRH